MTAVTLNLLTRPPGGDWDWRYYAACAETDPEAFFPEKGRCGIEAKRICARCEVRAECLDFAMTHEVSAGVWGGLNENERRKLRRSNRRRKVS